MKSTRLLFAFFAIIASLACAHSSSIQISGVVSNQIWLRLPENITGWNIQESSLEPENWAKDQRWGNLGRIVGTNLSAPDYSISFNKSHQFLRLIESRWRSSLETSPDFVVFLPPQSTGPFSENQHFLVVPITTNRFLAVWTTASKEGSPDQRVVYSLSSDLGTNWTEPMSLAGDTYGSKHRASWAFPVVIPERNRVFVFWNAYTGVSDAREDTTGLMGFRYSDDFGSSWSDEKNLEIPKGQIASKDSKVPENWIVWQTPLVINSNEAVVGFTRWASSEVNQTEDLLRRISEVAFMRIEGLGASGEPMPRISVFPSTGIGLRVAPNNGSGISVVQEPSLVQLSDGTYFCVARTLNGSLYWSRSKGFDIATDWEPLSPLLFDDGTPVRQPIASAPIYKIGSSNYFLLFHNNSGDANGGISPTDYLKNRRPAFVSHLIESLERNQPVRVLSPSFKFDNSGSGDGPMLRTEVATYPSFFTVGGFGYLWYPDRKHYLLGKRFEIIDGKLLASSKRDIIGPSENVFKNQLAISEVGRGRLIVVSEPAIYHGTSVNLVVRLINSEGGVDQDAVGDITLYDQRSKTAIVGSTLGKSDRGVKFFRYKPVSVGVNDLEVRFNDGMRNYSADHSFLVQAPVGYILPSEVRVANSEEIVRIDSRLSSDFSNRLQWLLAKRISVTNSGFEQYSASNSGVNVFGWKSILSLESRIFIETNSPISGTSSLGIQLDSQGSYVGVSARLLELGVPYKVEFTGKSDQSTGSGIQIFGAFDKNMAFWLNDSVKSYCAFGTSTNIDMAITRLFGSVPNARITIDDIKLERLQAIARKTNSVLEMTGRQLRAFDRIYLRISNIFGDQYIGPIEIYQTP